MRVAARTERGATKLAALLALGATLILPGAVVAAPETQLDLALCDPEQNTFSTVIDNTYFPLPMGMQWVLTGQEQGTNIGLRITVTGETATFYRDDDRDGAEEGDEEHSDDGNRVKKHDADENGFEDPTGIETLEVEELEWQDDNQDGIVDPDEALIEISLNYYAQTQDGTACYFGESVDIYEGGEVVSHEGAWRADEGDNAPGIFMPANPQVGMTFQQEFAPGVAEDTATIVRLGRTVTVPAGTFTNALKLRDFNPLDGSTGIKFFAPDFGIIRDGPLDLIQPTIP